MNKLALRFYVAPPFIDLFTPLPVVAACLYSPPPPWSTGVRERASSIDPVLAVRKYSSFLRVVVVDGQLLLY